MKSFDLLVILSYRWDSRISSIGHCNLSNVQAIKAASICIGHSDSLQNSLAGGLSDWCIVYARCIDRQYILASSSPSSVAINDDLARLLVRIGEVRFANCSWT